MRTLHLLAAVISASSLLFSAPGLAANAPSPKQIATPKDEPSPLCGQMAGRTFTVSDEHRLAGMIFDQKALVPGKSCKSQILLAGLYLDLQGQPVEHLPDPEDGSVMFLTVAAPEYKNLLSAKPSIHDDILARQQAVAEGLPTKATLAEEVGLRSGRFYQHDFYLHTNVDGYRVPFKECKKIAEGDDDAVCEFIYENEYLGLTYRVIFNPSAPIDYELIRLIVTPILQGMRGS